MGSYFSHQIRYSFQIQNISFQKNVFRNNNYLTCTCSLNVKKSQHNKIFNAIIIECN